jgi:hypothetical protein
VLWLLYQSIKWIRYNPHRSITAEDSQSFTK